MSISSHPPDTSASLDSSAQAAWQQQDDTQMSLVQRAKRRYSKDNATADEDDQEQAKPARTKHKTTQSRSTTPGAKPNAAPPYKRQLEALQAHMRRATETIVRSGQVAHSQGKHEEAIIYYSSALEFQPNNLVIAALRCEVYFSQGLPHIALELADALYKHYGEQITPAFVASVAKYRIGCGAFVGARAAFQHLLRIEPTNSSALQAIRALDQIIQNEELARQAYTDGDLDTLANLVARLEGLHPPGSSLWRQWKTVCGNSNVAIKSFFPHFERGERHMAMEQISAAQQCYRAQLVTHPDHPASHSRLKSINLTYLGDALIEQSNSEEASLRFDEAIACDRESPLVPVLLVKSGFAAYNMGNFQEAIDSTTYALALNKLLYRGHHIRGLALAAVGRFQSATNDLRAALAVYREVQPARERKDWDVIVQNHLTHATQQLEAVRVDLTLP